MNPESWAVNTQGNGQCQKTTSVSNSCWTVADLARLTARFFTTLITAAQQQTVLRAKFVCVAINNNKKEGKQADFIFLSSRSGHQYIIVSAVLLLIVFEYSYHYHCRYHSCNNLKESVD